MEIQTKHLPHYQFKYWKLKCVVIGWPIFLFFVVFFGGWGERKGEPGKVKMLPLVAVLEERILQNGS